MHTNEIVTTLLAFVTTLTVLLRSNEFKRAMLELSRSRRVDVNEIKSSLRDISRSNVKQDEKLDAILSRVERLEGRVDHLEGDSNASRSN